jgi:ABC-2 type transport system permease protein
MNKKKNYIQVSAFLVIIVLINVISSFKFGRFDLTEEKIHSLSPKTIEILQSDSLIKDELRFEIYLEGDFPPELRKLQLAIKEKLNEFKAYAGDKIYYEFINPSENENAKDEVYKQLYDYKLFPTLMSTFSSDSKKDMLVFGGILIRTTNNVVIPIQLLQPTRGKQAVQIPISEIENTINDLEYSLLEGIYKVVNPNRKKIGFLQGHGELTAIERSDVTYELSKFHAVDDVTLDGKYKALDRYDALVIAKPTQPISDKDQYIIDQFIMKGGKVAWLIDPVEVNRDTLLMLGQTFGLERKLNNIDGQIFTYGVRLNKDLLVDVNSAYLYFEGGKSRKNWFYYPLIDSWRIKNKVVDNLDPIRLEYASSLDILTNEEVKKTPLLITSDKTMKYSIPVRINYQMIQLDSSAFMYNAKPYQNVAVELEGEFTSYFKNRLTENFTNNPLFKHTDKSGHNKMLVIGDGDIIRNEVDSIQNVRGEIRAIPFSLGRDRYDYRIKYGNKEFFVNAMESLLGIDDLIPLRSKTITLRPLNKGKIAAERSFWRTVNIGFPIFLIVIYGLIHAVIRKKRFV